MYAARFEDGELSFARTPDLIEQLFSELSPSELYKHGTTFKMLRRIRTRQPRCSLIPSQIGLAVSYTRADGAFRRTKHGRRKIFALMQRYKSTTTHTSHAGSTRSKCSRSYAGDQNWAEFSAKTECLLLYRRLVAKARPRNIVGTLVITARIHPELFYIRIELKARKMHRRSLRSSVKPVNGIQPQPQPHSITLKIALGRMEKFWYVLVLVYVWLILNVL